MVYTTLLLMQMEDFLDPFIEIIKRFADTDKPAVTEFELLQELQKLEISNSIVSIHEVKGSWCDMIVLDAQHE